MAAGAPFGGAYGGGGGYGAPAYGGYGGGYGERQPLTVALCHQLPCPPPPPPTHTHPTTSCPGALPLLTPPHPCLGCRRRSSWLRRIRRCRPGRLRRSSLRRRLRCSGRRLRRSGRRLRCVPGLGLGPCGLGPGKRAWAMRPLLCGSIAPTRRPPRNLALTHADPRLALCLRRRRRSRRLRRARRRPGRWQRLDRAAGRPGSHLLLQHAERRQPVGEAGGHVSGRAAARQLLGGGRHPRAQTEHPAAA